MIYSLCLNPAIDKYARITAFRYGMLNRIAQLTAVIGGKGINAAKVLKALKEECLLLTLAPDSYSLEEALAKDALNYQLFPVKGSLRTDLKVTDQKGITTEFNETGNFLTVDLPLKLENYLTKHLKADDILILSGSIADGIERKIYQKLLVLANKYRVKTILDADDDLFKTALPFKPYLIKPNKAELCRCLDLPLTTDNTILFKKARSLLAYGIKYIIVSLGKDGAYFIAKDESFFIPAFKTPINNSIGAGDAMVAGCAYALARQLSFRSLASLAVAAATVKLQTPLNENLSLSLMQKYYYAAQEKIITL